MPVFITLLIAKAILYASRLLGGGGGSALPGLVAEKIDPKILGKLAKRLQDGSVIVTGTNGKTTTARMIATIMKAAGEKTIANRAGSNLSRGITSALVEHLSLFGKSKGRIGLFEVDEAAMPAVAAALQPKAIVVLNLFRDQLDRYGELDRTASLIGSGIAATQAQIWLNADDPLVAHMARFARHEDRVHFFGIDEPGVEKLEQDRTADSIHCPVCDFPLKFDEQYFGHVGRYWCPTGDFRRPEPELALSEMKSSGLDGQEFRVADRTVKLSLPGIYNAYNALAALGVARSMGIDEATASTVLESIEAAFGRVEKIELDGRDIYLLLIKNPTGFNQIIQTFLLPNPKVPTLVAINDKFADGRDVSWLWDAGIEALTGKNRQFITSGIRAHDMALRLKYADIKSEAVTDLERAIAKLVKATPKGEKAFLLPTYTAMLETRKILGRQVKLKGIWE